MTGNRRNFRIIAVELHKRSFGFAVFESPASLLDWGTRRAAPGAKHVLGALLPLIKQWNPTRIAVVRVRNSKGPAGKKLSQLMYRLCANRTDLPPITSISVAHGLGRRPSRHAAAVAMSQKFPFLATSVPGPRKLWQSEAFRMQAFGAIFIGLNAISD